MSMQSAVTSPCIEICQMNEKSGYCQGCWRTLEEIAGWGRFSAARKTAILEQLATRRQAEQEQPAPSQLHPDP